jgi:hypothetical protein
MRCGLLKLTVLLGWVLAQTGSYAVSLPDQLTTDFPGRPAGAGLEHPAGGGDGLPGLGSENPNDPWAGLGAVGDTSPSTGAGDGMTTYPMGSTGGTGSYTGDTGSYTSSSSMGSGGRGSSGPTRAQGLAEKLRISGSATASLRGNSVSGNETVYGQQYSDTGSFDKRYSLTANGRLWGGLPLYIRASASGRPYAPTTTDWTLIWHERSLDITYGDVQARLARNQFAVLDRRTKGLTVVGDVGKRGTYELFLTESKGITRKESIRGEGTAGPYYLRYTPVREETVRVRVDEQDIPRSRYTIEPETGRLAFDTDLIVLQNSVISVVYEESRAGQARGLYGGVCGDFRLGNVPLSVTYITQGISGNTTSTGGSVSRQEEFIPNSTTGPFSLSYRPVDTSKPIVAYVDGVLLEEDKDFTFTAQTGVIQFFNIVPATATLRVQYYSIETEAQADTKKQLLGLDTGYRFGNLTTALSWAHSQGGLLTDGSPAPGGNAWNARFSWVGVGRKLQVNGRYQQQDAGFSKIEATSFDRDESGWTLAARYAPSKSLSTRANWSSTRSRTGLSLGGDSTTGSSSAGLANLNEQMGASAEYRYGSGQLSTAVRRSRTSNASTGTSTNDGTTASWSQRFGNLNATAQWSRTGRATVRPVTDDDSETTTTKETRTATDTRSASLGYRWADRNRVQVSWSDGHTRDLLGSTLNSSVRSLSGDLAYSPLESVTFSLRKSLSESSGATYVTSDTTTGLTSAEANSLRAAYWARWRGVTALQTDSTDTTVVNTRVLNDSTSLRLSYRPSNSLSLELGARQEAYESAGGIGYMADQSRRTYNADVSWDASRSLRLDARWTAAQTTYLQRTRGRVWNSGWGIGVDWNPSSSVRLSAGYDLSSSLSPSYRGSSSGDTGFTVMSSNAYDNAYFRGDWAVSKDGQIAFEATLYRTRGDSDAGNRRCIELSYSHRVNKDFSVRTGGRWVNFSDLKPLATVNGDRSFRALSYYAELQVGF